MLLDRLTSDSLLRLWKTGGSLLVHNAEDDDETIDVWFIVYFCSYCYCS